MPTRRSGGHSSFSRALAVRLSLAVLLVIGTAAVAQPPANAPQPSPHTRGEKMLDAYFKDQVSRISSACLTDLTTKAEWEKRRRELRRQFFEMMGLSPMPPKTAL